MLNEKMKEWLGHPLAAYTIFLCEMSQAILRPSGMSNQVCADAGLACTFGCTFSACPHAGWTFVQILQHASEKSRDVAFTSKRFLSLCLRLMQCEVDKSWQSPTPTWLA